MTNRYFYTRPDPRYYQLAVQLGLLLWGSLSGYFMVPPVFIGAVLITALSAQWALTRYYSVPFNPLSTLNTSLSVLLLLQADHWGWMALAAALAISSKFLFRLRGRHVFNPSNFGIVVVLLSTDATWVAHGKWGHAIWLALWLAGLGLILLMGWRHMLTSISFAVMYSCLLFVRAFWLGDPLDIPLHQLQNGALLIFLFFMLSDPMTTPSGDWGRVLFGCWVALLAAGLLFYGYVPNAFLYALACSSPLVLLINHQFKGSRYAWLAKA